jgi:hypothetical protein
MLATDAANGFMYQPQFPTIAKKGVKGLWKECRSSPTTSRRCTGADASAA